MTEMREVMMSDATAHRADSGLVVEGLTVVTEKHGTPVVEDISFRVAPGQVMGLVGESGSGKSTVGVALLGLARQGLRIAAGSVCIDGVDILSLPAKNLQGARGRLVAYVPQDPISGLNPALTVGRQLREAIVIHRDTLSTGESVNDRVRRLMDEVGLPSTPAFLNSYPHQMSGGQQQRVGIAMAFSCRPRVIVLDEPTTGLDVTTQRHVLDTVRELTAEHNVTSVYVSHDLAVVAQLADATSVLYAGRLVEHAATEAIFRGARHPYTVGLLKAVPSSARSEILVGIEGRPPRPGRWPRGCSFADRCASVVEQCRQDPPELRDLGDTSPHQVRCFRPEPPVSVVHAKEPVPRHARPSRGDTESAPRCRLLRTYEGAARHHLRRRAGPLHSGCRAVRFGKDDPGPVPGRPARRRGQAAWNSRATTSALIRDGARRSSAGRCSTCSKTPYSSLNPRMTVRENLEEPLRYFYPQMSRRERTEKAYEVLGTVALSTAYTRAHAAPAVRRGAPTCRGRPCADRRPRGDGVRRDHLGAGRFGAGAAGRAAAPVAGSSEGCRCCSSPTTWRWCAASRRR